MARPSRYALRAWLAASAALAAVAATSVMVFPAAPALAADTATINGSSTFQTMAGFGFSEAFGQAADVMSAPASAQQQVLSLLFSPTSGAGLNIIRNWIGAGSGNTIEPNAPSSPTATPSYVSLSSINSDSGQLWFDQQAKASYGVTNIFADAWSAPGYMKTNNSAVNGGTLCGVPNASCSSGDWRQAFANYLVQYAKDYAAAGVPLSYVGPENEANLSTSYDSMLLDPSQTANLLDVLGPAMQASGLSTQVECCATEGWNYAQQYASAIEADPTALADTSVFGSHGYTAAPTSALSGWSKPAWQTEWFGTSNAFDAAWDDGTTDSGFTWAQRIYQGLTGANLSAYLFWEGADVNNANGGLLKLNSDGSVSVPSRLWAFGNYSRYIHPGAVRIGAASSNSGVDISAYKNTDGSTAIVALNTLSSSDAITYSTSGTGGTSGTVTPYLTNGSSNIAQQSPLSLSGGAFSATIPARSLVTYVIKPGDVSAVTVTNPGNKNSVIGNLTTLQIQASDSSSGQTLTYTATGLPPGLSINPSTGLISGTPAGSANTYTVTVTVTVTDSSGAQGSTTFLWAVSPSDNVPTVIQPANQSGTVGTPVSLQIQATDGLPLTYSATGLPPGLSINSSTGLITGTPTTAGTSNVTVTAVDTAGASGSATFTWTITQPTSPPPGGCHVTYQPNNWPGGFTANVIVTNNGTAAINNWTLTFSFAGDQKITNAWNATYTQTGQSVSLKNVSYNATIAPGGSQSLGFQGTYTSNSTSPSSFSVNGTACT